MIILRIIIQKRQINRQMIEEFVRKIVNCKEHSNILVMLLYILYIFVEK